MHYTIYIYLSHSVNRLHIYSNYPYYTHECIVVCQVPNNANKSNISRPIQAQYTLNSVYASGLSMLSIN